MLSLTPINFGVTVLSAPVVVGNEMFFAAADPTHGVQLWESDGTDAGTVRLTDGNDVNGGIYPSGLTAVGGTLYFSADDGVAAFGGVGNGDQLWKSNGTAAGTVMVTDSNDGVVNASLFPYELTAAGGELYFVAPDNQDGEQLFESNGTAAGTTMVKDIPGANGYPGSYPANLTAAGNQLYFSASGANQGNQLWMTNGTASGTVQLTTGNASNGGVGPQSLAPATGPVYFAGYDPTDKSQVWSSNGTASGTKRLTTANASGSGMTPQFLTAVGNTVYFAGNDGVHGTQLWSSNGTTTTMLTSGNVSGGGLSPNDLTAVGSTLYFTGNDGVHGTQLWSSNGTAGGTAMVADINGTTTADVTNITDVNGTVYFAAYTTANGFQIWQTDGTAAGTVMDTGLATGTTAPSDLTAVGNDLYFKSPGADLWEWAPSSAQVTPTIGWPSPAGITYGTALTAAQLDATASVPGTFTYSPAAGTVLKAGTDTLSVIFTPADTTDYTIATDETTIVVAQATPTLTWASPAGIVYGAALTATQLDATANVAGTFAYSPAAGTVPGAGSQDPLGDLHPYRHHRLYDRHRRHHDRRGAGDADDHLAGSREHRVWDGADGAQLDATASVAGTFAYSPAAGTVLGAGSQTLSVTFTPTDTTDYKTATAGTTIAVAQATPTITWARPAGIVYGTALTASQLDATSTVAGTFAYSPAAGTVLKRGPTRCR